MSFGRPVAGDFLPETEGQNTGADIKGKHAFRLFGCSDCAAGIVHCFAFLEPKPTGSGQDEFETKKRT